MNLDVTANRTSVKYSKIELLLRFLWACLFPLFRFSPRLFWGWRRMMLRFFGARVGKSVHIFPSVNIFAPWHFAIGDDSSIGFDALIYNLGPVTIGERVTISQRAHLCAGTHNYENHTMPLEKPPIIVGDEAWICADCFIGPGVTVGEGAVTAARSVVVKDVPPWTLVGGNPAKPIRKREMKP